MSSSNKNILYNKKILFSRINYKKKTITLNKLVRAIIFIIINFAIIIKIKYYVNAIFYYWLY